MCVRACVHARVRACVRAYVRECMRACVHVHVHLHTCGVCLHNLHMQVYIHLVPFMELTVELFLSRPTKPEHAAIRVWSTSSWRQVTTLTLHSLTVTQLAFSHSGHYLLAVSCDRCWSLWKLNDSDGMFLVICPSQCMHARPLIHAGSLEVTMEAHTDKSIRSHTRIIWACSWSHDDQCFATASRDKKVSVVFITCLWLK